MEKATVYELMGFLLAFLGIGIAYYSIHFGIRLEKTKSELEHTERMRALELGRSLPGDGPWLTPLRAGVPVAAACRSASSAWRYSPAWPSVIMARSGRRPVSSASSPSAAAP